MVSSQGLANSYIQKENLVYSSDDNQHYNCSHGFVQCVHKSFFYWYKMLRYIDWMFTLRFSLHVRSYDMNDDHQWRTHIIQSGDYLVVCVDHDSTQSMTNAQSFYQYKFAAFDNGKIKNWFKCKFFGRTLNYMCLICIRQSLAALVRHMNRQCGLSRRIHRDRVTQSTIWCPPIQYQYCSRSVGHTKICSPQQRMI